MASSSSFSMPQLLGVVSEKLTHDNYLLWKAQFLPAVHGAQYMGILDGSTPTPPKTIEVVNAASKKEVVPNPEYAQWVAKDQQLLSYLLNSLTKEALAPVVTATMSEEAWTALEVMFSAHSKTHAAYLRKQLATIKKGGMSSAAYFNKMCSIRDELSNIGKIIDKDETINYIINGLDYDYNPLVSSILGRVGSISLSDVYSQLLAYDLRMEMFQGGSHQSSANIANHGRGGGNRG